MERRASSPVGVDTKSHLGNGAKQFAEKLSGSPCYIVLVIPTPNAAEESATTKSSVCTMCLDDVGMTKRGCSALKPKPRALSRVFLFTLSNRGLNWRAYLGGVHRAECDEKGI